MLSSNFEGVHFSGVNSGIPNNSGYAGPRVINNVQNNFNKVPTDISRVQQWSQPPPQTWQPMIGNLHKQNYIYQQYNHSNTLNGQQPVQSPPGIDRTQQFTPVRYHPYLKSSFANASPVSTSSQFKIPQVPLPQQQLNYGPILQQNHVSNNQLSRSHQAQITLVPNSNGSGFQAIVKRKRKRTMFTTEQVEYLETVFSEKSYVTRDDRQGLVEKLKVSDSAVKVWFQNRRIRGKKENEGSFHEGSIDSPPNDQSFYSPPNNESNNSIHTKLSKQVEELSHSTSWDEELMELLKPIDDTLSKSSSNSSVHWYPRLDDLEAELNQKTNEFGNIILNEKVLRELVNIIDIILPNNIDLGSFSSNMAMESKIETNNIKDGANSNKKILPSEEVPFVAEEVTIISEEDDTADSGLEVPAVRLLSKDRKPEVELGKTANIYEQMQSVDSTYEGSIFEPISPALLESTDEESISRWTPSTPEKSLQRLFDLHFC